jgi:hypothetical protein
MGRPGVGTWNCCGSTLLVTTWNKKEKSSTKPAPAQNVADDIFGYMAGKLKIVGDGRGSDHALEDWECG